MRKQTLSNRDHFVKIKQFKGCVMEFLPNDYKAPTSSGRYMKLKDGENKIRILSKPVLGFEDWEDKSPIRYRMGDQFAPKNPENKPKHFWAFIVWNYEEEKIQVLSLTQATVQKAIEALSKDADWGAPYFYDIKIYKSGKDKLTKYSVSPLPHKELHPFIMTEFYASPCNLEALFTNTDPFAPHQKKYTEGVFEMEQEEDAMGE